MPAVVTPPSEMAAGLETEAEPVAQLAGPEGRKAIWSAAIGYGMDGFDLLIIGFLLPYISAAFALSHAQAASIVTATLIGAVMGGVVFGVLSDRLGRVRVLTWTILLFAIFTGLCATAQNYWELLAYRTIAGVGFGGEFGIGMALVAECWPTHMRARASSYVGLGSQVGILSAAILTPLLIPAIGWRGMFVVGVFPAIVAFLIRRNLKEPARFTTRPSIPWNKRVGLLVSSPAMRRISFAMLVLCSIQNFCYYGLMVWLPGYLNAHLGYSLTKSAVWTVVTIVGMAAGIYAFGQIADRVGRKPAFLAYMLGAAIMVILYSQLHTPFALLVAGAVMGFFVNGMLGGYGVLMSELYVTSSRSTAQNVIWNLGRAIGGFGPIVIGMVATRLGFYNAISLLALLYLLDIAVLWLLIPESGNEELA